MFTAPGGQLAYTGPLCLALAIAGIPAAGVPVNRPQPQRAQHVLVSGRLLEEGSGRPLAGEVLLERWIESPGEITGQARPIETGPEGAFSITGDDYGPAQLTGLVDNHGRAVAFVFLDPAEPRTVDIVLPMAGAIRGVVTRSDGTPLGGARVELRYERGTRPPESGRQEVRRRARTEGLRFVSSGPPAGRSSGHTHGLGEFWFMDIDPRRPFTIVVEHEELGETTTDVMMLQPGEVIDDYRVEWR